MSSKPSNHKSKHNTTQNLQRKYNRERVLEFELEMHNKLTSLDVIEADLSEIGKQRQEWLRNISQTHRTGSDIYHEKLALIKAQTELTGLNLRLDRLKLESQTDIQALNLLIEYTRPLELDETPEQRELELTIKARQDTDVLKESLQHSLDYRIQLGGILYNLFANLNGLKMEAENEQEAQIQELKHHIEQFMKHMETNILKSKQMYQTIIKEYLILRHNAQVAKEILVRSQNDASFARSELQTCLNQVIHEAKEHRERLESASKNELQMLTNDLRAQVIEKEKLVEELAYVYKQLQQKKKHNFVELKQAIKSYDKQYRQLEYKRREDLTMITKELTSLRQMIDSVEKELAEPVLSPSNALNANQNKDISPLILTQLKEILQKMTK